MAQPMRIEPDLEFVKELQAAGGESLKKCYQCATCSVACPISPANEPYPRKEMVWAQWGLKDKLEGDIDIWLCHNCGTCSDLCPRGAKPGDLLSALRNMTYKKLMGPSFLGKWMSSAKYLPLLILFPAIIWMAVWIGRALTGGRGFFPLNADGVIEYKVIFYGDYFIDPIFILVTLFVVFTLFAGVKKLLKSFKMEGSTLVVGKKPTMLGALAGAIGELITHSKFKDCGEDKSDRKLGHMALFYGFVCLAIVTGTVAVGHWGGAWLGNVLAGGEGAHGAEEASGFVGLLQAFGHWTHTAMPQAHPVKLLANLGALLLVIGLGMLTFRRMSQDDKKTSSSYYDWYLLGVIWVVALTGIGSEIFRLMSIKYLAFPVYYMHLVAVMMLFLYLPWSKLGHLVYRVAALSYARYMGRKAM